MQILVFSDLKGEIGNLRALVNQTKEFPLDAICFCGNIVSGNARLDEWVGAKLSGRVPNRNQVEILEEALEDLKLYKEFCNLIDSLGIPVMVIPGNLDASEERYFVFMQQAAFLSDNIILLHENLTKLGRYVFTGFGGELRDNEKEDYFVLQYSRREINFGTRRMCFLKPPRILLLHSPPVSTLDLEGGIHKGSQIVNDIIAAVSPEFLFCGHVSVAHGMEKINQTIVVNPGLLAEGRFSIVDTQTQEVKPMQI